MSNNITIARPYAKALFEVALNNQQLLNCAKALHALSIAVSTPVGLRFLQNPAVDSSLQIQLLCSVVADLYLSAFADKLDNFIHLLALNKRVLCIPSIYMEFGQLLANY